MRVFGPIPSRRLGQSLGINNIPPKICTYACNYCQVGKSIKISVNRDHFYVPKKLVEAVIEKVKKAQEYAEKIDYLTFVPDGEPTLDFNLGKEIELLKCLGINIAVITNSSLLWRNDVRNDLYKADLVSVKMDAADEKTWRKINHPHKKLKFKKVQEGLLAFSRNYAGKLITETMLMKGVNDNAEQINQIAGIIAKLNPQIAYLAVPTRPTAFDNVKPADEDTINLSFQIFNEKIQNVEYLIGYEGNAYAFTGDIYEDILSITAVHPMREDAVNELLKKGHSDKQVLEKLIDSGKIIETQYEDNKFYVRKLKKGIKV